LSIWDQGSESVLNLRNPCAHKAICQMLAVAEDGQSFPADRIANTVGTNQIIQVKEMSVGKAIGALPQILRDGGDERHAVRRPAGIPVNSPIRKEVAGDTTRAVKTEAGGTRDDDDGTNVAQAGQHASGAFDPLDCRKFVSGGATHNDHIRGLTF
jgi:hypothetical protein